MIQYILINRADFVGIYELYFLYIHVNQISFQVYLNVTFNLKK